MKRARRSLSFLRASLRLCLLVLGLAAGSLVVSGAGPAWWAQRGVTNAQPPDDYAAANQGQLKNIATHAFHELEEQLAYAFSERSPEVVGNKYTTVSAGEHAQGIA